MRLARLPLGGAVAGVLALAACGTDPLSSPETPQFAARAAAGDRQYILAAPGNQLPAGLEKQVEAAGGRLAASLPQVGLAIAQSARPDFAARAERIQGIAHAVADQRVAWVRPDARFYAAAEPAATGVKGQAIEDGAFFFAEQWAPRAIQAPAAWAAGQVGQGARVAVLDGGIWAPHPDLAPNIDAAHAVSFATDANGNPTDWDEDVGPFWHGTHVAGIVAGAAALGTIGIAPRATIIPVKVLHDGSGTFGGLIQGLIYASTPTEQGGAGADIVNLSLGATFERTGKTGIAQLASFLGRVTTFAYQQGVLIVAAAGNGDPPGVPVDFDHSNNKIVLPAQSTNVLTISALGPVDFASLGALAYFDRLASYSNFGQSAIDFGAPGGDFTLFPNGAWFLDMVLSTNVGGWARAAGTSQAAPAAAGVAALIVGKFGRMHPAQLEARLRASAEDLGKPGNDDAYGAGRVNAFRAVQ
ncbi:MAG TPA: S8 family serine peptidase [Gemmatimonadales bacterium]|nr:S8 family serine peptidase [Gemmatimonadales bacterium]